MQETTNYKFPKPEDDDFFDIKDFNNMMDKVDAELKNMSNTNDEVVENAKVAAETVIHHKAGRYIKIKTVIPAAGWTDTMPLANTIIIQEGLTGDYEVKVIPSSDWTEEQYNAWSEAIVASGEQMDENLTLKAYGEKPSIDIPIILLVGDTIATEEAVLGIESFGQIVLA